MKFFSRPLINGFLLIIVLVALGGCNLLPSRNQGALQVTTGDNVSLAVHLDDNRLGQTPYFDERIKTGTYTLKLTELNSDVAIWQTKVSISKRTLTVVNYMPATSEEESSSEILLLEPLADKQKTKLSISTLPDHVVVKLNGTVEGFSPLTFDDLDEGDQEIILEAPGFETKTITAKTTLGHHLIIQAELARDTNLQLEEQITIDEASPSGQEATESAEVDSDETDETDTSQNPDEDEQTTANPNQRFGSQTAQDIWRGYESPEDFSDDAVEILPATVGINWLRVRSSPNGLANNEVARVSVGDYFPYIEQSDDAEWKLIEYAPGEEGWIAAPYGRVVTKPNSTN